jgi:ankyrin repeat protein
MRLEDLFRRVDGEQGLSLVDQYLASGGDINAVCPGMGWTLLHAAAEHQNLLLIKRLVKRGANLHARDPEGWTPLHVAVDTDIDTVRQKNGYLIEINFNTPHLLLSLGANPKLCTQTGHTPRDIAKGYGAAILRRYDELIGR